MKKRYSLAVILGMTTMLLALAPQLRADRTDHQDNDHWNAMSSAKSHGRDGDSDLKHADAWRSDDNWHRAKAMCSGDGDGDGDGDDNGNSNNGNGNTGGSGSSGNGGGNLGGTGIGTTTAATPEPSSLVLLLSALIAVTAGAALKKVVA